MSIKTKTNKFSNVHFFYRWVLIKLLFRIHIVIYNLWVYSPGTCISYQWYYTLLYVFFAYVIKKTNFMWNLKILLGESSKGPAIKVIIGAIVRKKNWTSLKCTWVCVIKVQQWNVKMAKFPVGIGSFFCSFFLPLFRMSFSVPVQILFPSWIKIKIDMVFVFLWLDLNTAV